MPATVATPACARRRASARPGCLCALATVFLLAGAAPVRAGGAPAGAGAVKTTVFVGRIVAATGAYASFRGAVHLTLRASPAVDPPATGPFAAHHSPFTFALRAPLCPGRAPRSSGSCVAVSGHLAGTGLVTKSNPDGPSTAQLSGHGRVAPLGQVTATGRASGLGFIRSGRFQLMLRLLGPSGSVTIKAQGPVVAGFSSPF